MEFILSMIAFIFTLGLIILVHEGGHFLFARRANILAREFAFGMGPILLKKKKGETLYSIRAFPIGGFCAIAGEEVEDDFLKDKTEVFLEVDNHVVKTIYLQEPSNKSNVLKMTLTKYDIFDEAQSGYLYLEGTIDEKLETFQVDPQALVNDKKLEVQIAPYNRTIGSKSKRQRAMVMFGGPLMNFLLALIVFFIVALFTGFPVYETGTIGEIAPDSPASIYELQENDQIVMLTSGNLSMDIFRWEDISLFFSVYKEEYPGEEITIQYIRDEAVETTTITPRIFINTIGLENDFTSSGLVVGNIQRESKVYQAGLRSGQIIEKIDGLDVTTWQEVYQIFENRLDGQEVSIQTNEGTYAVIPYTQEVLNAQKDAAGNSISVVSIVIGISSETEFRVFPSIGYAFRQTFQSGMMVVNTLQLLFSRNSGVGVGDLSGFVGIFSMTGKVASQGFVSLLSWVGMLSVNIGLLNLLPIPALDGGRLVFLGYEAITGKKPNQKLETAMITVTFFLLMGLIIFVTYSDIMRLF